MPICNLTLQLTDKTCSNACKPCAELEGSSGLQEAGLSGQATARPGARLQAGSEVNHC